MGARVRRCRDFREPDQSPWLADDAMRTFVNTYGSHLREEGAEPVSTLTCCKVNFCRPPFRAMCDN